jgi:hypothetical protein
MLLYKSNLFGNHLIEEQSQSARCLQFSYGDNDETMENKKSPDNP